MPTRNRSFNNETIDWATAALGECCCQYVRGNDTEEFWSLQGARWGVASGVEVKLRYLFERGFSNDVQGNIDRLTSHQSFQNAGDMCWHAGPHDDVIDTGKDRSIESWHRWNLDFCE